MKGGDDRRGNVGPIICWIEFPIDDDGWRSEGSCCCICYELEACFVLMQASIPVEWCRQWRGVERMPLPRLPHLDSSDRTSCQVLPLPDIASSNGVMTSVADAVCGVGVCYCTGAPGRPASLPKARCSRDVNGSGSQKFLESFTQNSSHRKSSSVP